MAEDGTTGETLVPQLHYVALRSFLTFAAGGAGTLHCSLSRSATRCCSRPAGADQNGLTAHGLIGSPGQPLHLALYFWD